ncbi:hypothetical protein [Bradyrhizobium lablabi]|uniref:hypothetical protein n=1 Tax=Bradyrhizobium lablabi TaxID=722472 RepID=UPI001BAB9A49|nr:hypothetical protein [Bradyrhizobium lablabi]MBR0694204.1 hypothetical protein [Bradyrhizobium lablabi]
MILRGSLVAVAFTMLLASGSAASADEYRPSEFLGLDLSRAALSPKRLGPPAQFAPVPIEANTDRSSEPQASAEPKVEEQNVKPRKMIRTNKVTAAPAEDKPRAARVPARAKLARRHTNPLDAQARDTRIQTWPCRSGGICDWH